MVTIEKYSLDIYNRKSGKDAGFKCFLDPLVNGSDEFIGDRTAFHFINELIALAVVGFNTHNGMCELSFSATLFHMAVIAFHFHRDGFPESYCRFARDHLHLEFVLQPVDNDLQVKFAHTCLGNWSGKFGKSTMTLALEDMKPGTLSGYDKVDGKKRNLTGTYQYKDDKYNLTLNEPGDKSEDGQFIMNIDKSSQTAEGTWESFDHKMKYPVKFEKEQGQVIGNKTATNNNSNNNTGNVQKEEPVLQILRATYGTAWKNYNVASSLNNRVNNGNIYVEVSNRTFGDPDPGKPKTLTVSYKYRGSVYNKTLHENMIFRVP